LAGFDVLALPVEPDASGKRVALPLVQTPFVESGGVISPDGKWLAYSSNISGTNQVYIQAFRVAAGKWQVSNNGGTQPLWSGDGKEIFYQRGNGNLTTTLAAGIRTGPQGVEVDSPHELFSTATHAFTLGTTWAVTPDGKRFLIEERTGATLANPLTVVLNWQDGLKK
jgi:hypothetical protein